MTSQQENEINEKMKEVEKTYPGFQKLWENYDVFGR